MAALICYLLVGVGYSIIATDFCYIVLGSKEFIMATANSRPTKARIVFASIVTVLSFPVVILFLAGAWLWLEGWIFGLWCDAMVLSNMIYLYLKDPGLLAERSKAPGSDNQKQWDKYLMIAIF